MYIVEKLANRMTEAMIKGTLKYPSDYHSHEEWKEHLRSDAIDSAIYSMMLESDFDTG